MLQLKSAVSRGAWQIALSTVIGTDNFLEKFISSERKEKLDCDCSRVRLLYDTHEITKFPIGGIGGTRQSHDTRV